MGYTLIARDRLALPYHPNLLSHIVLQQRPRWTHNKGLETWAEDQGLLLRDRN